MLKVWTPKASREAENKSGITEGYLFNGYSKRKLYCLAETYEELAKLYRSIPDGDYACIDRKDMLYQKQIQETKEVLQIILRRFQMRLPMSQTQLCILVFQWRIRNGH